MEKFYGSFGQNHAHAYNGRTYDKDCIIEIEANSKGEAHDKMFEVFGTKWSMLYDQVPNMEYFPRGIMNL